MINKILLFSLIAHLVHISVCNAQFETEVFSPAPEAGEYFGGSVAIFGDFMIIGANGAEGPDHSSSEFGVAYIFIRSQQDWVFHQKIAEPEINQHSLFGFTVDIDEKYAIIGAPKFGNSGLAFTYIKNGDTWDRQLMFPQKTGKEFGHSVAINENFAIVGGIKGNGSAWIYEKEVVEGQETWVEQIQLTASDGFPGYRFGYSVDINENVAVVSAWAGVIDENINKSAVYVFERIGTNWVETAKLHPQDAEIEEREQFGRDVELYGDVIIVGTPGDSINESNYGSAYIFEKIEDGWVEKAKLYTSDSSVSQFGRAVSINDELAVVGAMTNDQGSVYIFKKSSSGWNEIKKLINQETHNYGFFSQGYGKSVSTSQEHIAIGHFDNAEKETLAGSSFIYDISYFKLPDPTGLKASQIQNSTLLQWTDNSDNETHFILERSEDSSFQSKVSFTIDPNLTTYVDDGIVQGQTYFYRIRASNNIINSEYSNTVEFISVVTSVEDDSHQCVYLFPNPTGNFLFIKADNHFYNSDQQYLVTVTDQCGRVIYTRILSSSELEKGLNVKSIKTGIYVVNVISDHWNIYQKVIIDH